MIYVKRKIICEIQVNINIYQKLKNYVNFWISIEESNVGYIKFDPVTVFTVFSEYVKFRQ